MSYEYTKNLFQFEVQKKESQSCAVFSGSYPSIYLSFVLVLRSEQQQANAAPCKMLFVVSGVFLFFRVLASVVVYIMWNLHQMRSQLGVASFVIFEILKVLYPLTVLGNSVQTFLSLHSQWRSSARLSRRYLDSKVEILRLNDPCN